MKFETLNSGKFRFWKRLSIGISLFVLVLVGLLTFIGSYAKYKIAQSVPLATGTIDYSLADLNVVAIQVQKKDEDGAGLEEQYDKQTDVPGSGYSINAEKSYCEINGNKEDPAAKAVEIEGDGTGISFSNVTKQGTKCYVYFDVDESGSPDKTLAQLKQNSQGTVDKFMWWKL